VTAWRRSQASSTGDSLISPIDSCPAGRGQLSHSFFDDERRRNLYRSVFEGYYANVPGKEVIFDTNRTWTGRAALIGQVFPQAKIICCVREVAWIIDSLEGSVANFAALL
jgi:hypothetical protein